MDKALSISIKNNLTTKVSYDSWTPWFI